MAYRVASNAIGGDRPNISQLQRDCQVSRDFVRKVESELRKYGTILTPSDIQARREGPVGPGSRVLDEIDSTVILFLYLKKPSRSLKSYVLTLELLTGTIVSRSISMLAVTSVEMNKCSGSGSGSIYFLQYHI